MSSTLELRWILLRQAHLPATKILMLYYCSLFNSLTMPPIWTTFRYWSFSTRLSALIDNKHHIVPTARLSFYHMVSALRGWLIDLMSSPECREVSSCLFDSWSCFRISQRGKRAESNFTNPLLSTFTVFLSCVESVLLGKAAKGLWAYTPPRWSQSCSVTLQVSKTYKRSC